MAAVVKFMEGSSVGSEGDARRVLAAKLWCQRARIPAGPDPRRASARLGTARPKRQVAGQI